MYNVSVVVAGLARSVGCLSRTVGCTFLSRALEPASEPQYQARFRPSLMYTLRRYLLSGSVIM